jgi:hypothetical protein
MSVNSEKPMNEHGATKTATFNFCLRIVRQKHRLWLGFMDFVRQNFLVSRFETPTLPTMLHADAKMPSIYLIVSSSFSSAVRRRSSR